MSLQSYWQDVRAGLRERPQRKRKPYVRKVIETPLDGSFCSDRGKVLIVTLHPDGLLELRAKHTRRTETIHLHDVLRYAIRCRVTAGLLERARERKARKAERLARERQARAEKRLLRPL
jgi:hypothetical protein